MNDDAARGAALLAVGVGEPHPFLGEAVDVGRAVAHQAVAVAAEVGDADVVAPDDEDVRAVAGAMPTPDVSSGRVPRSVRGRLTHRG